MGMLDPYEVPGPPYSTLQILTGQLQTQVFLPWLLGFGYLVLESLIWHSR